MASAEDLKWEPRTREDQMLRSFIYFLLIENHTKKVNIGNALVVEKL